MNTPAHEAEVFARYLIHRQASPQAVQIYTDSLRSSQPNAADQKLLQFMIKHPRLIGLIDAGLVFHNPTSEARRRLYVMLAILEASPENSDLFLPKQRRPLYIFFVIYAGVRAVIKAVLGLLLVKVAA